MKVSNIWKHFRTITHHKNLVMVGCFKVGLIRQGLLHDMSKYNPIEFLVGCRFYQGTMSPNNAEREAKGYSSAWLHHKGRNKHHLEYWLDYGIPDKTGENKGKPKGIFGMKMPVNYAVEMFIDRCAASKNYQKEKYADDSALIYYMRGRDVHILHDDTRALLELLLYMLAKRGEKETYRFIREEVLSHKLAYEKAVLEPMIEKIKAE